MDKISKQAAIQGNVEVIIFLVKNELAFRGSYDIEKHMDEGLFEKIFNFTKENNEDLRKWESHMPHHYTYRSADIQNEIIKLLASMIHETVANDVMNSDVPYFTLLEDGTKDKKNNECVSIAARYVRDGRVHESIISMETFALAAGLFRVMSSLEFVFTLVFMKDLLQTIEPVTKALQGRVIGYKDSMPFIRAVLPCYL